MRKLDEIKLHYRIIRDAQQMCTEKGKSVYVCLTSPSGYMIDVKEPDLTPYILVDGDIVEIVG